jgi:serine/threonine-protein kinase
MLPATPTRLGRYEILDELGKGAAGVVYLARDPLIGRLVALKTFRIGYSVKDHELQQFRARFIREAQSAGILSHPNIVTIHDVVEESDDGMAFIAMEYVRGTNLKQLLQGGSPLDLAFAHDIVRQVGEALDYAHSKGVVHRDVKPANIIITADNRVKITDFGIARIDTSNLTQEGQLLGTPNYMAPEQIMGREVDHRADLFSLGVVLYEMLTRHKPFSGENLTVVSHRIVYDQFTPPRQYVRELPPGVEAILNKALAKDPAERYQRGRDLADDLRRVAGDRPAPSMESLNETQSLAVTAVLNESPVMAPPAGAAAAAGWRRWFGGRKPAAPLAPAAAAAAARPPSPEETITSASSSSSLPLADVVPLVPPAPRAAAAPAPARRVSARRLVALALVGIALPVFGVAAARLVVSWAQEPPPATAGADYHPLVVPLLAQGVALLRTGQAPEAAAAFLHAERLAPDLDVLGSLRRQAERTSQDRERRAAIELEIGARTEEGRTALARRSWDQAEAAARRILELDPHHPGAQVMLEDAAAGRVRQAAARKPGQRAVVAAADQPAAPATAAAAEPETAAGAQGQPTEATLAVDFYSQLPQGTVIVSVGGRRLLQEPFDYREKGGLPWSRKASRGGSFRRFVQVPVGAGDIRVHVAPKDRPAEVEELSANFPGGQSRRLVVQLAADGGMTARLY